ncbi:MAG: alanine--tRNA ligase [Myxococcales bacterium]|nr:alanine--tRNA ligase [Myxococcales bacterium]MCB9708934.1 alanine--tRNA ligase [Myxococcales bacterium]
MSLSTSHELRRAFLDYFQAENHEVVHSSALVPDNDPTLMFTNAGMVPFKDVFTGNEHRPYVRATSSQRCIRISGKHNDLENVGVTARHHTFFEMLGNFSFGDYFKEQAIFYAWDFVTRILDLDPSRLAVTVFGGERNLAADTDAEDLWKKITGLPDARIQRFGADDNFWQMGDVGPCGPCSEMHVYLGDGEPDPRLVNQEPGANGRGWMEIWNLVFMQFDRDEGGVMRPLPAPSIDTGAGLERLSAVVQGRLSNYDTDLFRPLIQLAAELAQKTYHGSQSADDVSLRVIADHARMTAFLIAEGVFPDRDGRSYVLRRVMRRAIRHGHRLGLESLFFHRCASKVIDIMKDAYPELAERRPVIEEITQQEEMRFRRTLDRGLELIAVNKNWTETRDGKVLPAAIAFELYDTFGFPLDLQQTIGAEQGFSVDEAGFNEHMQQARERSAGSKVGDLKVDALYQSLARELGRVDFVGYEDETADSQVLALLSSGVRVEICEKGQPTEVVTRVTPFYAQAGGQVGDRGLIRTEQGAEFEVTHTERPVEGLIVHHGVLKSGTLKQGDRVRLEVDHALRHATRCNHSATHLLHYALRKVLGPQAVQKGSLVAPDRLRFDYAATRPLSSDEIRLIETLVNAKILENAPVTTEVLPYQGAKDRGAIGIFEEKYGEMVRMLSMTDESIELCGGTHASRTGDIGLFKVLSDSGLAAGVRRLEAATGERALAYVHALEEELSQAATLLRATPQTLSDKLARHVEQHKQLAKDVETLRRKLLTGPQTDLSAQAKDLNGVRVLGAVVEIADLDSVRELADQWRDKLAPAIVLLGTTTADGKALLVCTVSKELTTRFRAGTLIKHAAAVVGGKGGGRPDFAQAGGPEPSRLAEAVAQIYALADKTAD